MKTGPGLCLAGMLAPSAALAHDAFGNIGPFYEGFLHPAADPLQAALVAGAAAFLAGRPIAAVRVALPVFLLAAVFGQMVLGPLVPPPDVAMTAGLTILTGLMAGLPDRFLPRPAGLALLAVAGMFAGLAPGAPPPQGAALSMLGGLAGILVLVALLFLGLDTLSRRVSSLAPAVAGSWVAAVGILALAFSL